MTSRTAHTLPKFSLVYDKENLGDAWWVIHTEEPPTDSLQQGMETGLMGDQYLTGPFPDRNEAFMWAQEFLR